MGKNIDLSKFVPIERIYGEDDQETYLLREMAEQAKLYLTSFKWCKAIRKGWFGWGIGKVCAVFLFEIVPTSKNVDEMLWVVVGDVPPAYLVTDRASTPVEVLEVYVELMREWVRAVCKGTSVDHCIPVNASPTLEHAHLLEKRLNFIRDEFIARNLDLSGLDG